MAGIFDALFRGLTGVDRNAQTADKVKDTEQIRRANSTPPGSIATHHPSSAAEEEEEDPILEPEDAFPTIMTPLHSSVYSSKTPSSTSFNTSRSLSTPGMDISFGPQSPTFTTRRRALPVDDAPTVPENSPMSYLGHRYKSVPIAIRHPEGSLEEIDEVLVPTEDPVTEWRKDQVKYMRRARLSNPKETKDIPTFNGPLSLPYARNPSGVDAVLADDSAYLTHVFGLRRGNHVKVHPTGAFRVTADGPTKYTPDYAKVTGEAEKVSSIRPLVIREPNQVIGLRQEETEVMETPKQPAKLPEVKSKAVEIKAPPVESVKEMKTSSVTVHPQFIPAAAQNPVDPFNALFNQAIANATRHHSDAADFNLRSGANVRPAPPARASYHDLLSLWKASNEAYARLPEDPTPIAPPKRFALDDITHFGSPTASSTPAKFSAPITPSAKGHKADIAKTWRNKPRNRVSSLGDISMESQSSSNDSMTMDQLFDKFSADEKEPSPPKVTFKSPSVISDPAIKERSSTPMKHALKQQKVRSPLGEASGILNASPMKAVSAKGTPGAGKHLKNKVEVTPKDHFSKFKGKDKEV